MNHTNYKPSGLIDFDKMEDENVLIAERAGAANCLTKLQLKDNFTFRERISCFGLNEIRGTYHVIRDTIYFNNVQRGRNGSEFYKLQVNHPGFMSKLF